MSAIEHYRPSRDFLTALTIVSVLFILTFAASLVTAAAPSSARDTDVPHVHDIMTVVFKSETMRAAVMDKGVQKKDSVISAVVLLQYNPALLTEGNPQVASAGRIQVDCAAQTARVISAFALDGNGNVLREEIDQEINLGHIRPETVMGKVAEFLCEKVAKEFNDHRPDTLGGHKSVTI